MIEIEILPKPKAETYDREIQVDLEDPQIKAGSKHGNFDEDDDVYKAHEARRVESVVAQVGLISSKG